MGKIANDGKILSLINKMYSLLYLLYFVFVRFLLSTITTTIVSTVDYPIYIEVGRGIFGYIFHPCILVGLIVVLGILAWRDRRWVTELIYPVIVLVLVYSSVYLL